LTFEQKLVNPVSLFSLTCCIFFVLINFIFNYSEVRIKAISRIARKRSNVFEL
jgi:hypothetical protein